MKLAIPVGSASLDVPVFRSFAKTPLFVLYDTETRKHEFIDNTAYIRQRSGGKKAALNLIKIEAAALISCHCGEAFAEVLNTADIKIYRACPGYVSDNIEGYIKGELLLYPVIKTQSKKCEISHESIEFPSL